MNLNKYHKKILRRLYETKRIGDKHTSEDNAIKGFPKSDRGYAKKALSELIKWNFIIPKKTGYGLEVSLNYNKIVEILQIIDDSD